MTFTKKKLTAAMTGALLASVGGQTVQAAVDLDNGGTTNANPLVYAGEIIIGTAGLGLTDAGTEMDLTGTLAPNGVLDDTDLRLTLTLSGGTFTAAPSMTIDDGAGGNGCDAAANACPAVTVFSGGGTSDSTVTFDTNTGTQVIDAGAHYNITLAGLTITDQSAITATVTAQIADDFGVSDLPGGAGSYASFTNLLSLTADTTADTDAIDVTQNSLFFSGSAGDTATNVGGVLVTESTAGQLGITSAALSVEDVLATRLDTITAANGFSAFNQGTSGGSIELSRAAGAFSTSDSTVATMATASYAAITTSDASGTRDVVLEVPAANTVAIAETTLTDTISVTGAATATYDASSAAGTVSLKTLSRNGSSARLTFALTPGGAYPMMIRVTNPASIAGPVTLTLTNDDGDTSAAVDITDIAGGPTGDLAAGASTGLLDISDVMAAVQAGDATFDLGATNKLRVDVVAEFGTTGTNSGVVLGAFSVSSDGTTFNMMTDASN